MTLLLCQVSGEYAMLYHAAQAGAIDLRGVLEEVLLSMRRAGNYILTLKLSYMCGFVVVFISESQSTV